MTMIGKDSPVRVNALRRRSAKRQRADIPSRHTVLRHLLTATRQQGCDQPGRATEFHGNEYRAKIITDSVRCFGSVSYGLHGRLQSGWSQPHSARAPVAIYLPMGS